MSVNFRPTLVRTAVLAALATPIIGHTQAAAPAAPAASASELQSITVTATRREDSLQDVPAALTAITAADDVDKADEMEIRFYSEASNPATYTPTAKWDATCGNPSLLSAVTVRSSPSRVMTHLSSSTTSPPNSNTTRV